MEVGTFSAKNALTLGWFTHGLKYPWLFHTPAGLPCPSCCVCSFPVASVNKVLSTGWLDPTEMNFLTFLEARNPQSMCQQGQGLSKVCREDPSLTLPSFWWVPATLTVSDHSSLYLCHHTTFSSVSGCKFPSSYKNTESYWIERCSPMPPSTPYCSMTSF